MLLQIEGSSAASSLVDSMYGLTLDPAGLEAAERTARILVDTLSSYGAYIVSVVLAIEVAKASFTGERVDLFKIGKTILLLFVLLNYNEIVGQLNSLFDGMMADLPQKSLDGVMEQANDADFSPLNLLSLSFSSAGASSVIAMLAHFVIIFIRKITLLFLYASGPVAFCVAMIPGFGEGVLKGWFRNYVAVQCWALTLLILDTLFVMYMTATSNSPLDAAGSTLSYIAFSLLYFMVPTLTNKVIGAAQSNSLMGKMTGVTTAAVMMGVKAVSGVATGGASIGAGAAMGAAKQMGGSAAGAMGSTGKTEGGAPTYETSGRTGSKSSMPQRRTSEN